MSDSPEIGLDLEDLELQLLPAWAKQSPDANRYAKYEGSGLPGSERREARGKGTERSARRQRDEADQGRPGKPREGRAGPPRRDGGRFDRPQPEEKRNRPSRCPKSVYRSCRRKGVSNHSPRQIKLTGRGVSDF